MQHSRFIKAITLFSSVFLTTAFLYYRSGGFEHQLQNNNSNLQTSHNGGVIRSAAKDSLIKIPEPDSAQRLLLYSSKSMVLTNTKLVFYDSVKSKQKTKPPSLQIKKAEMMSSSKSAIIFTPPSNIFFSLDSIKFDIKKIRQKKNQ